MPTTVTPRRPGRRPPLTIPQEEDFRNRITNAIARRERAKADLEDAIDFLAHEVDEAITSGLNTRVATELLGVSRQAVYKLCRERVRGIPLRDPVFKRQKQGR